MQQARKLNPLNDIFQDIKKIMDFMVVKDKHRAMENETMDMRLDADRWIHATLEKDTWLTYTPLWTFVMFQEVQANVPYEITQKWIAKPNSVPHRFREHLRLRGREEFFKLFQEKNNYYRTLNGQPIFEDEMFPNPHWQPELIRSDNFDDRKEIGNPNYDPNRPISEDNPWTIPNEHFNLDMVPNPLFDPSIPEMIGKTWTIPSAEMSDRLSISYGVPIHLVPDTLQNRYIRDNHPVTDEDGNTLYNDDGTHMTEYQKTLRDYPDREYLNYLGLYKIDIFMARRAYDFEIIRYAPMDRSDVNPNLLKEFGALYSEYREYVIGTLYNSHLEGIYENYRSFMGTLIMILTTMQISNKALEGIRSRQFLDDSVLHIILSMFNIPRTLLMTKSVRRDLVINLLRLTREKGTDDVYYSLIQILGYHDIIIRRLMIMRGQGFESSEKIGNDGNNVTRLDPRAVIPYIDPEEYEAIGFTVTEGVGTPAFEQWVETTEEGLRWHRINSTLNERVSLPQYDEFGDLITFSINSAAFGDWIDGRNEYHGTTGGVRWWFRNSTRREWTSQPTFGEEGLRFTRDTLLYENWLTTDIGIAWNNDNQIPVIYPQNQTHYSKPNPDFDPHQPVDDNNPDWIHDIPLEDFETVQKFNQLDPVRKTPLRKLENDPYFLGVDIKDPNPYKTIISGEAVEYRSLAYHQALAEEENREFNPDNCFTLENLLESDPNWWTGGKHAVSEQWLKDSNYTTANSKYITIEAVIHQIRYMFETVFFTRMILDNRQHTDTFYLEIPEVFGTDSFSIFDLMLFLVGALSIKNNLTGEMFNDEQRLIAVAGFNFDFDTIQFENFLQTTKYVDKHRIRKFLENLSMRTPSDIERIFNDILYPMRQWLESQMVSTPNRHEFLEYEAIYKALFTYDITQNSFIMEYMLSLTSIQEELGILWDDIIMYQHFYPRDQFTGNALDSESILIRRNVAFRQLFEPTELISNPLFQPAIIEGPLFDPRERINNVNWDPTRPIDDVTNPFTIPNPDFNLEMIRNPEFVLKPDHEPLPPGITFVIDSDEYWEWVINGGGREWAEENALEPEFLQNPNYPGPAWYIDLSCKGRLYFHDILNSPDLRMLKNSDGEFFFKDEVNGEYMIDRETVAEALQRINDIGDNDLRSAVMATNSQIPGEAMIRWRAQQSLSDNIKLNWKHILTEKIRLDIKGVVGYPSTYMKYLFWKNRRLYHLLMDGIDWDDGNRENGNILPRWHFPNPTKLDPTAQLPEYLEDMNGEPILDEDENPITITFSIGSEEYKEWLLSSQGKAWYAYHQINVYTDEEWVDKEKEKWEDWEHNILSIVLAMETHLNMHIKYFELALVGQDLFFKPLVTLINHFKSIFVQLVKHKETSLLFGDKMDSGGNTNLFKLYDEVEMIIRFITLGRQSEHFGLFDTEHRLRHNLVISDRSEMIQSIVLNKTHHYFAMETFKALIPEFTWTGGITPLILQLNEVMYTEGHDTILIKPRASHFGSIRMVDECKFFLNDTDRDPPGWDQNPEYDEWEASIPNPQYNPDAQFPTELDPDAELPDDVNFEINSEQFITWLQTETGQEWYWDNQTFIYGIEPGTPEYDAWLQTDTGRQWFLTTLERINNPRPRPPRYIRSQTTQPSSWYSGEHGVGRFDEEENHVIAVRRGIANIQNTPVDTEGWKEFVDTQ